MRVDYKGFAEDLATLTPGDAALCRQALRSIDDAVALQGTAGSREANNIISYLVLRWWRKENR